jgi:hypothetical protein
MSGLLGFPSKSSLLCHCLKPDLYAIALGNTTGSVSNSVEIDFGLITRERRGILADIGFSLPE